MRVTCIRYATHLGLQFKTHWLIKRKVKVPDTEANSILASMGVRVFDPKDVIRPAIEEEFYEAPVEAVPEEKEPVYIIHNKTVPIETFYQSQHITNTIAFNQLPSSIYDKVEDPLEKDNSLLTQALIKAHLLDAQQDLLPLKLDPINEPGFRPPRRYGIKTPRMIKSLLYSLVMDHNQRVSVADEEHEKMVVQNPRVRVAVEHSGHHLYFDHREDMVLFSRTPMSPFANSEEVKLNKDASLPDISPLSPFAYIKTSTSYDLQDCYSAPGSVVVSPGSAFAPHTVFIDYVNLREPRSEAHFLCMALLHCFSSAAIFAKRLNKNWSKDLEKPVSLNLIHSNGRHIQFCCFQLNTLNLTGPTKNLFWYHPWDTLCTKISFLNAHPTVENINVKPLCMLRAMC